MHRRVSMETASIISGCHWWSLGVRQSIASSLSLGLAGTTVITAGVGASGSVTASKSSWEMKSLWNLSKDGRPLKFPHWLWPWWNPVDRHGLWNSQTVETTLNLKHLVFCVFLRTLKSWLPKEITECPLIWKEDFGPSSSPALCLLSPGKTLTKTISGSKMAKQKECKSCSPR